MNNKMILIAVFILFFHVPLSADETGNPEETAKSFVNLLVQQNFSEAENQFASAMKQGLPEDQLKVTWSTLIAQVGPFKKIAKVNSGKYLEYDIVLVTTEF